MAQEPASYCNVRRTSRWLDERWSSSLMDLGRTSRAANAWTLDLRHSIWCLTGRNVAIVSHGLLMLFESTPKWNILPAQHRHLLISAMTVIVSPLHKEPGQELLISFKEEKSSACYVFCSKPIKFRFVAWPKVILLFSKFHKLHAYQPLNEPKLSWTNQNRKLL